MTPAPRNPDRPQDAAAIPRTAMEWLEDYYDCLMGEHGDWWQERANEAIEEPGAQRMDGTSWQSWREIRQAERAPSEATP